MQVLITQGDFSNRDRYKYLSQTLQRLTSLGVVPVINGMWCVVGPGVWCVVCGVWWDTHSHATFIMARHIHSSHVIHSGIHSSYVIHSLIKCDTFTHHL